MSTQLGSVPLTVGSLYTWQTTITKDGQIWDLSVTPCVLWWKRPDGTTISRPATSSTSLGVVTGIDIASVLDVPGKNWTFSVFITGFGYTRPTQFEVVQSP